MLCLVATDFLPETNIFLALRRSYAGIRTDDDWRGHLCVMENDPDGCAVTLLAIGFETAGKLTRSSSVTPPDYDQCFPRYRDESCTKQEPLPALARSARLRGTCRYGHLNFAGDQSNL